MEEIMQRIWKYEIPLTEEFKLEMPRGKQVVRIDVVDSVPYMWVLTRSGNAPEEYGFELHPTGVDIDTDRVYVGTFRIADVVFHLFELYDDIPF
jgi:hypothetical protein